MMGERPPDPLRLGDTLNAGSSTGWTDEKHMLYISSLEEAFVTQLYDGEVNSRGVLYRSPNVWRHKTSYKVNCGNTKVDQGYWGMVEADGAESRVSQAEHIGSPSCYDDQEDRKSYYMDDDASTTEPRQERISYHARPKNSGGSSASHFHWHGHSLSRRIELSDQNFIDEETEVSWEQSRGCSKKRLKHAADTTSGPAAPSGNANLQLEVFHHAGDYSDSSSDFDIGLLNAEPASCKDQGPIRRSV